MINQEEFRRKEESNIVVNLNWAKDRVMARFKHMMELWKEILRMIK